MITFADKVILLESNLLASNTVRDVKQHFSKSLKKLWEKLWKADFLFLL